MEKEKIQQLISAALAARENAYCKYSGFAVGAAIVTDDGAVYSSANIENAAYTVCICAERVALFNAVSAGAANFAAVAIAGGK